MKEEVDARGVALPDFVLQMLAVNGVAEVNGFSWSRAGKQFLIRTHLEPELNMNNFWLELKPCSKPLPHGVWLVSRRL